MTANRTEVAHNREHNHARIQAESVGDCFVFDTRRYTARVIFYPDCIMILTSFEVVKCPVTT